MNKKLIVIIIAAVLVVGLFIGAFLISTARDNKATSEKVSSAAQVLIDGGTLNPQDFSADEKDKLKDAIDEADLYLLHDNSGNYIAVEKDSVPQSGTWPENEYTALIPEPTFGSVGTVIENPSGTSVSVYGGTQDGIKAYVSELKAAGFDKEVTESSTANSYKFTAKNADGSTVVIDSVGSGCVISINK